MTTGRRRCLSPGRLDRPGLFLFFFAPRHRRLLLSPVCAMIETSKAARFGPEKAINDAPHHRTLQGSD
jgi:hypothetical protein